MLLTRILILLLLTVLGLRADEGMYPISDIQRLDLAARGLEIPVSEIYDPQGTSLIDGICNVSGCTGSFVSARGLILTNHHCAFRALQAASAEARNYLEDGFAARELREELPAAGYRVRITAAYRDVSEDILEVVQVIADPAARTRALERRIKELVTETEAALPGKRAEVAEMFPGKTYILFIYTYLKDIRLVAAPPRSVGNFGGEVDNWMWPRHSADFALLRAYTAPDGFPAEYAPENIPYQPRRVLSVAPEGVEEHDFVFLLGYPGRTYRHRTSHYIAYLQEVYMPAVVELYQRQIAVMTAAGEQDPEAALKLAPRIKSLSNTLKNYRGKLQGLERLDLVDRKIAEEQQIQDFIDSRAGSAESDRNLLAGLDSLYRVIRQAAPRDFVLRQLTRSSDLLRFAGTVVEASHEREKPDVDREADYMDRNWPLTVQRLELAHRNLRVETDRLLLADMLRRGLALPDSSRIPALQQLTAGRDPESALAEFLEEACRHTRLTDPEFLRSALELSREEVATLQDPFIRLARNLYPIILENREAERARKGYLDRVMSRWNAIREEFLGADFIPDANGTLRLTYGSIRGYRTAGGVGQLPFTTLDGILTKYTGTNPFDAPAGLLELIRRRQGRRFIHPRLGRVPVALLYDLDTSGGNSGSPLLNARGEVVGLNFDRVFEATINDFAWHASYSRSIGVDIRYILWLLDEYLEADHLLLEMGVAE